MRHLTSALFALLAATPAAAEPLSIASIPIEAPDHEAEGQRIFAAIQAAIDEAGELENRGASAMRLDEARLTFSCFDESEACMAQVGALLQADRLLWGTLEESDGVWSLRLSLLDVPGATFVRRDRWSRAGPDAIDRLAAAARAFVLGRPVEERATLVVRSEPSGAAVSIDGAERGRTPLAVDLEPGRHVLALRLEGRAPVHRTLLLTAGRKVVEERLAPAAASAIDDEQVAAGEGSDTGFWLGVGAGGVALASAGIATALGLRTLQLRDEAATAGTQPENDRAVSEGEDTRLLTNVAWGVTAAAAAASAYFLIFYEEESAPSVGVTATPGGVAVGGTF